MRRFKATLAYDGTAYSGWQIQADQPTLQETFERAGERIVQQPIRAVAAGRTDAGVHALGQVVAFSCSTSLDAPTMCRALNAYLPADMQVLRVELVPEDFCPIRGAIAKRYRYVIQDGPVPDVFQRHYAWWIRDRLDDERMRQAAKSLIGQHDFASFQTSGSPRASTVRTITELTVERVADDHGRLHIEVEADGFLYNMVRNIVGTLAAIGRGKESVEWVEEVLAAKDRRVAGMTAPPQGLFLLWVKYG